MRPRLPLVLLLAAVLPACNQTYDNPFTAAEFTQAPAAGDTLTFASNAYASAAGAGLDLYSVNDAGGLPTRLTTCNDATHACQTLGAALASDRERAVVVRATSDTNGDGRLTEADGGALVYFDLPRQASAELVAASRLVTQADWSPIEDTLVYSAQGAGGEDLFRTDAVRPTPDNAQNTANLTCAASAAAACDATIRERHPRIDPTGTVAAYERIDASGRSQVFIFENSSSLVEVTAGGPGGEALAGTPYVVGSDADPAYSPDAQSLVFRRLTSAGGGRGTWDIMTVGVDGTNLRAIVSGASYRSAPDWGPRGIVFSETDASGAPHLVVVQPDGSGRREILALAAGFEVEHPRWLH